MSVRALNWAFEQVTELPVDKLILLALADFADQEGQCFPGQDVLAKRGLCSTDTVQRAMKRLISAGLIERTKRYGSTGHRISDAYRVTIATTTSSGLNRNLRPSESATTPQFAAETKPHSCAPTKPQSCGLDIEPLLNQKKEIRARAKSEPQKLDPDGVRLVAGQICLSDDHRSFWLPHFDNDPKRLDLALLQASGYIEPNCTSHSLAVKVGRQLARAAGDKRDRDQRYAKAAETNAAQKKNSQQPPQTEKQRKSEATRSFIEKLKAQESGHVSAGN